MLTLNTGNGELAISTSDITLHGETWTLRLFFESTVSSQPNDRGVYEFDVVFTNPCTLDTMSTTTTLGNVEYFIGAATMLIEPTYNQVDGQCPSQYGVSIIDNSGNEAALDTDQSATLTLSDGNGNLAISTSNLALSGQVWTVKLYREST